MTFQSPLQGFDVAPRDAVFDDATRARFAFAYPEIIQPLDHLMTDHPLLSLEALASLGESLPSASVEYNPGDLPIGIDADAVPRPALDIGETIRTIDSSKSWAVLKNIEQRPQYADLLHGLLGQIQPEIERATGALLRPQGFIFISSPESITPFHFDPEHNILMQLRGQKWMTVFPAGDARFAPAERHEAYHAGGQRNLEWRDEFTGHGTRYHLVPGKALYVPVMSPHFVENGPEPSISLSITWRSQWSFAEADNHAFNALLRRMGLTPTPPERHPAQNLAKSYAWRALRKARVVR